MKPEHKNGNVVAHCPDCDGAITTFEYKRGDAELGGILHDGRHEYGDQTFTRIHYRFFICAGCGRGAIGKFHDNGSVMEGVLEDFYPVSVEHLDIPAGVPSEVLKEFREAERCQSFGAQRAASALYRSTLEKMLKANGYKSGTLADRINEATDDGVITAARRQLAHDDIRVLGNNILHDEWREVTPEEAGLAHKYVQRILEDLYDDRATVEQILLAAGRIQATGVTAT